MYVKTYSTVRETGEREEDSGYTVEGYVNTLRALGWESLLMFTLLQAGNWSGRITSDEL